MTLLFKLLCMHALCDYPLQGDFLARGKNHLNPIPGVPWWQCLTAHAFIQAGGVYLVTGKIELAVAELVAHWLIDFGKCSNRYGFNEDQAAHVVCKIIWVIL